MSEQPYKDLAMAIILQAVEDVKSLQRHGIIRNGEVMSAEEWPKRKTNYKSCGMVEVPRKIDCMTHPSQVKELLLWMRERKGSLPLAWLLEESGSNLTQQQVCKEIGI